MSEDNFAVYMCHRAKAKPGHETIRRLYPNARGIPTIITMPTLCWDYADWLHDRGDIDFGAWVIHCDQNPWLDWPLSALLMHWLWRDECNRFRNDEVVLRLYPPMGYSGWAEEFDARRGPAPRYRPAEITQDNR